MNICLELFQGMKIFFNIRQSKSYPIMNILKIYFAGSIRGGRDDAAFYLKIIHELKKYGEVLTEHVGDDSLISAGEQDLPDHIIHDRDIRWIEASDIVIAEVTTPSLGVGYEIATAQNMGKRIYCLFNTSKRTQLSAMIRGSNKLIVFDYQNFDELKKILIEITDQ
jgi:hypothetical protein